MNYLIETYAVMDVNGKDYRLSTTFTVNKKTWDAMNETDHDELAKRELKDRYIGIDKCTYGWKRLDDIIKECICEPGNCRACS